MKNIEELIEDALSSQRLNILLFGPAPMPASSDEKTRNLQNKRQDIKVALEIDHIVHYGEDVVNSNMQPPDNNIFLQESFLLQEYDLIINLVYSPGTIVEATMVAAKPELAAKSHLFLDENYVDGLVGHTCVAAREFGAELSTYNYPNDIVECNLLGMVRRKVRALQYAKYLS